MSEYIRNYESRQRVIDDGLQRYMTKIYGNLVLFILLTFAGALATLTYSPLLRALFKMDAWGNVVGATGFGVICMFAPFVIAMYVSRSVLSNSFRTSRVLLGLYAVLTGCSLSSLFFCYTSDSLHKTLLITIGAFVTMSLYGYFTARDLTSVGSFCIMAMWGLIISSVINIFLHSDLIGFVTSFVGVIAFVLFVAHNTQNLKALYYSVQDTPLKDKVALMGVFSLYLNFLNIFTYLLHFFGERKRND